MSNWICVWPWKSLHKYVYPLYKSNITCQSLELNPFIKFGGKWEELISWFTVRWKLYMHWTRFLESWKQPSQRNIVTAPFVAGALSKENTCWNMKELYMVQSHTNVPYAARYFEGSWYTYTTPGHISAVNFDTVCVFDLRIYACNSERH